jgi:hypothetical protein
MMPLGKGNQGKRKRKRGNKICQWGANKKPEIPSQHKTAILAIWKLTKLK